MSAGRHFVYFWLVKSFASVLVCSTGILSTLLDPSQTQICIRSAAGHTRTTVRKVWYANISAVVIYSIIKFFSLFVFLLSLKLHYYNKYCGNAFHSTYLLNKICVIEMFIVYFWKTQKIINKKHPRESTKTTTTTKIYSLH